jgi:ubiquinone/menaquinone biosynthesis C-methylase UbiE
VNDGHKNACASDGWREMVREQVIPWAVGSAELGDDVLEVGPGYGATTDVLREMVPRLTAVEIDEELAADLATKLAGTNVEIVVGDATALDFPDERFTGATSFNMLHHVHSAGAQDQLLAEVARVLRPGAVFIASDSLDSPGLRDFHHDDIFVPVDPADLPRRLGDAGFVDVDIRTNEYAWTAQATRR